MKRLFPLALLLMGCGGIPTTIGIKSEFILTPSRATVAPGGTVMLTAYVLEGSATSLDVAIREGSTGGTLTRSSPSTYADLTYTAPSTPGTYHIDATFTGGPGVNDVSTIHKRSATITVAEAR